MRIATALFLFLLVSTSSATSQIYPDRDDRSEAELYGPVRAVVDFARSWNNPVELWNPLVVVTVRTFTEAGGLVTERRYAIRQSGNSELNEFDSTIQRQVPVPEQGALAAKPRDGTLLFERHIARDESGRQTAELERDYQRGTSFVTLSTYDTRGRLARTVQSDSATGHITRIENFYYRPDTLDGRLPARSWIRTFDPETDPFRNLADTASVPARRIGRTATNYVYGETATPVIWFSLEFGTDTTLDVKQMRRYDSAGRLAALTTERFTAGEPSLYRAQLFNQFADAISTAEVVGDNEATGRTFAWIYDGLDRHGNWTNRRQYVVVEDDAPRVLLGRVDRRIGYFE